MSNNKKVPIPLCVGFVDGDIALTSVAEDVLNENNDFRSYVERMESIGEMFVKRTKSKLPGSNKSKIIRCDGPDADKKEWLDCCLRKYLSTKAAFTKRCGSRRRLVTRIGFMSILFLLVLYFYWPLWNVLIDVDANTFYKTLQIPPSSDLREVKKAYRAQMKKWHPDVNRECGEYCRSQARKIQEAHDVLMARGDQTQTLANNYHKELLQLRSFVFFRVYQMAYNVGQETTLIIGKLLGLNPSSPIYSSFAPQAIAIVFFTIYEIFYGGGFDIMMLFQVFYVVVSVTKSSAMETHTRVLKRIAYVDLLIEAVVTILPIVVGNIYNIYWYTERSDFSEEVFRMLFGCFYLSSYLYQFMPNIYDNFRKRTCTVTLNYSPAVMEPFFSPWTMICAEFGFIINDLFAFTCRIPSGYRVAAMASHFIYLCQFLSMPGECPRRREVVQDTNLAEKPVPKSSPPISHDNSTPSESGNARKPVSWELDRIDIGDIEGIDAMDVYWQDIAKSKYKDVIFKGILNVARRDKDARVELMTEPDFVSIACCAMLRDGNRIEALERIKDPFYARLLAAERGPSFVIPYLNVSSDIHRGEYIRQLDIDGDASLTPSGMWRKKDRKTSSPQRHEFWSGVYLAALITMLCGVIVLILPNEHRLNLARYLQPILDSFKIQGPANKVRSDVGSSLLTIRGHVLCSPDIWDAMRQLKLYASGN